MTSDELLNHSGNVATKILGDLLPKTTTPTQQPPKDAIREAKAIINDFGKLQTRIDRYFEKWTNKGYDEKTIGSWVKPLMREAGYGRSTITRVLPEAAKFKPRGKRKSVSVSVTKPEPVSTKMMQNAITTKQKQAEAEVSEQHLEEREQQQETQPQPAAIITPTEVTPTTSIPSVIEYANRYSVEMTATVHTEADSEEEAKPKAFETLRTIGDLLVPIEYHVTQVKNADGKWIPAMPEESEPSLKDWDNTYHIWGIINNADSYSEQQCKRLLKEGLHQLLKRKGEIARLSGISKENEILHTRLGNLKKEYKLCGVCDKKGTGKYFGYLYCAKHLKDNLKLNENLGPMINNVMGRVMGVK